VEWHGEQIVDVPPRTVAHEGPVYDRPYARPVWQDALQADGPEHLARPSTPAALRETLLTMVASPNLCSKEWITSQYDRYVLGNTVLAQPEDVGMIRIDEHSGLGVAISTDCNGRFTKLDPYTGTQLALAESYRNVVASGAVPLAVTNCLNFGSPEDPDVMWQFAEATRGLADGCLQLGIPVTGGNVSFYNQTGDVAILPTPVVGVLGVIQNVDLRTPIAWANKDERIFLLGDTFDEFAGSEWANHVHDHLGGMPPKVDLELERLLGEVLVTASSEQMIVAAHDVSDGGIAQVLVEMALHSRLGARIRIPEDVDPFVFLFSESAARAVVAASGLLAGAFIDYCSHLGLPVTEIGLVTAGDSLEFSGHFTIGLEELREAHTRTIPALFA
ncbi:MAG: AIR synthase related protein, partial [Actinomycetota bacterium]|nr:AIR synthase related protein [Actinomycetota bacterium]